MLFKKRVQAEKERRCDDDDLRPAGNPTLCNGTSDVVRWLATLSLGGDSRG